MIVKAYVCPHPPIILPEIGRGEEKKVQATLDSMDRLGREVRDIAPDTIVISSPHGPNYRDGFFLSEGGQTHGDFGAFGFSELSFSESYDEELADEIRKIHPSDFLVSSPSYSKELDHGAMVPLYYIEKYYKSFKLVRLGLSALDANAHYELGRSVAKASRSLARRVVYIGSGDLSHALKDSGPYEFREEGPVFDEKIVNILKSGDFESLIDFPEDLADRACQCGLKSFQILAGAMDDTKAKSDLYSYEGPFGVGYSVVAFTPSQAGGGDENQTGRDPYIDLAKKTIDLYAKERIATKLPDDLPREMLEDRAGVFVSIHKKGDLRGCIGTLQATRSNIAEEIVQNAISASQEDPRFNPVRPDELEDLDISVDVLLEPEEITSIDDLDIKKYGIIVSKGIRKGVLLPNIEGVDTVKEQIRIALLKARINPKENYKIERFEVIRHDQC